MRLSMKGTCQTSAEIIMKNDQKDLENLNSIVPMELLQPLVFTELQPAAEYPADLNLNDGCQGIGMAMDELGGQY